MDRIEKCPRFEKAAKILKTKYGLNQIDCIKLKEKLFEEFAESTKTDYYFEISIEECIKDILNRADH